MRRRLGRRCRSQRKQEFRSRNLSIEGNPLRVHAACHMLLVCTASSAAPSGSALSLTSAYPFPVHVGDDGCSGLAKAPRDPKQCATPLAAHPRGRVNISTSIPKAECERVMADVRGYCHSQMPLGDLDLEYFVCMYDPVCSAILCAIRSSDCCPFHCAEHCLPSCPDNSPPPPPPRPPPPPPCPPYPPAPPPPSPPPPPPNAKPARAGLPPPSASPPSFALRVALPLPPPLPPLSLVVRPKCLGGVYLLDVARSEQILSQLRKWCYFYQNVNNQTDFNAAPTRSTGTLRLTPGPSREEWELSTLLRRFCEQNGAMPDNMNRGDGWAIEEECSSVLKVLGSRFGGNVCTGACAPWAQPCPTPPPPPPPPPSAPCGPARGFGNGNEAPYSAGSNDSTTMRGRANSAPAQPRLPSGTVPPLTLPLSRNVTSPPPPSSNFPASPPSAPCPSTDLNRQRPVEQESEEWKPATEPMGLHAPLVDQLQTIELH